jgi:hypothetical protein
MQPSETGRQYDAIASWWEAQQRSRTTGLRFIRRAIDLCTRRSKALDVGDQYPEHDVVFIGIKIRAR